MDRAPRSDCYSALYDPSRNRYRLRTRLVLQIQPIASIIVGDFASLDEHFDNLRAQIEWIARRDERDEAIARAIHGGHAAAADFVLDVVAVGEGVGKAVNHGEHRKKVARHVCPRESFRLVRSASRQRSNVIPARLSNDTVF